VDCSADFSAICKLCFSVFSVLPASQMVRSRCKPTKCETVRVWWGGDAGDNVPSLFSIGGRVPHSPTFGLKFVQKLVYHCCNWLLTETHNFSTAELISICYRHSNTSSCIAGQDQRSAVVIFLTCMSVRVCKPKSFKNLCLSLVLGVPHFFFRTTPLETVRRHGDSVSRSVARHC